MEYKWSKKTTKKIKWGNSTAYSDTRPVRTCWVCINSHSSKVCNGISVRSLPNENRVCGILSKAFTVTQSMELSAAQKTSWYSWKVLTSLAEAAVLVIPMLVTSKDLKTQLAYVREYLSFCANTLQRPMSFENGSLP